MGTTPGRVVVVVAAVLLAVAAVGPGRSVDGEATMYAGARYPLPEGARAVACEVWGGGSWERENCTLAQARGGGGRDTASVRLWRVGSHRITLADADALPVRVIRPVWAYLAAAGFLLLLLGIPYGLFPVKGKDEDGHQVSAWYALLSEAKGGYSLGRVQLLIWFAPAFAIYGAMSLPLHGFAGIPASLAVLLGLSGATTLLGSAANPATTEPPHGMPRAPGTRSPFPPHPSAPPAAISSTGSTGVAARPDVADLVRDWQNQGDLSRYQYLLLAMLGGALLAVRFFDDFSLPVLPQEFLTLVGASQATYLGAKAVKTGRINAEARRGK